MKGKERFEVLLENMDGKIDLVLEGHKSLDRKIDRGMEEARLDREDIKRQMALYVKTLSGKIDGNREEIGNNRTKLEGIDRKLSSSRQDYRDHENRIRVLEAVE